ncbi:DUF1572 family protein [Paenibacillus sp. S28]|uniref:DUF1572 family protein n=1 Tax=Paenibacillus sp. S28 TaxID=2767463 RepID=UPI00190A5FE3|nr:DUF1572 family protein [Paenibacillus sp. S28]MBJ9987657.1 DUF1572 family protein [Paenibacillus sp. S28]
MELALEFIQSMKVKLISEQRGTLKAIEQVSEEDITWHPTPESNSIANLVAHIRGAAHSRVETILYNIPDMRDRDKEFERGLMMTKKKHTSIQKTRLISFFSILNSFNPSQSN